MSNLDIVETTNKHDRYASNSTSSLGLTEDGGQHEGEHDDGEAKGHHQGKEDPVVGLGCVEHNEVEEDACKERCEGDEEGVDQEPGQPKHRIPQAHHSQTLLDSLLLFIHHHHQHWPDKLGHGKHEVDGDHGPKHGLHAAGEAWPWQGSNLHHRVCVARVVLLGDKL